MLRTLAHVTLDRLRRGNVGHFFLRQAFKFLPRELFEAAQ